MPYQSESNIVVKSGTNQNSNIRILLVDDQNLISRILRIVLAGLRQKTIRKQPQTQVAQGIYTKH
jgi:hypothetical protein